MQSYISWKSNSSMYKSIQPSNYNVKLDDNISINKGRANPLKHWRKQLFVNINNNNSAVKTIKRSMDLPSSNILTLVNISQKCLNESDTYISNNNTSCTPCASYPSSTSSTNNAKGIRRSASTVIDKTKNYYTTHSKYLYGRVKTYNQNQTLSYNKEKLAYYSTSCYSGPTTNSSNCNVKTVIYKPNNANNFYINKLKYDNIQLSAKNLENPWGKSAANSAKYTDFTANYTSPYNIKSKYELPICNTSCKKM